MPGQGGHPCARSVPRSRTGTVRLARAAAAIGIWTCLAPWVVAHTRFITSNLISGVITTLLVLAAASAARDNDTNRHGPGTRRPIPGNGRLLWCADHRRHTFPDGQGPVPDVEAGAGGPVVVQKSSHLVSLRWQMRVQAMLVRARKCSALRS
ncbi:SPW repeat protein [Streptomyces sp. NPDC058623]|uniref:SPW repeat domain-containing protein n=1 Tax=Streptomyces sp. NPDC058623 TaxID=3346563 RepID=UPI00365A07D6